MYDRDLLSSNEMFGTTSINLTDAFIDASLTKKPIAITKKYYENYLSKESKFFKKGASQIDKFEDANKFWLKVKGPNKDGEVKDVCKICVQIDIIPIDQ